MSFLRKEAEARLGKEHGLMKINQILNWQKIEKIIGSMGRSGYGPKGYEVIPMVKALILQAWHSLSDPGLEEALKVRLDFMVFTGFEKEAPDETTLCRFRNHITKLGIWNKVLKEVNHQLESCGLKVKNCQGAIIDATIIESAARPRNQGDGIVVDREEDHIKVEVTNLRSSADPDGRWLKKGKRNYYGYKGFMVTDTKQGFIERVHVTPAHVSEMKELENALGDLNIDDLYGDKGYACEDNRQFLKNKGIKDRIMRKAYRNTPLTYWEQVLNKLISKRRYLVEQGFGTLKRIFNFRRASYFTTVKVQAQMTLKAIAFNLLKASRQVKSV
jgi:IS5 family transposase